MLFRSLSPQRETPLVVWSNRKGTVERLGSISPAFLPLHTLDAAGIEHPFYTGFLRNLHDRYRVIDRHLLITADGGSVEGWTRNGLLDRTIADYRLLQYDAMFGEGHARDALFPAPGERMIAAPARGGKAEASPLCPAIASGLSG